MVLRLKNQVYFYQTPYAWHIMSRTHQTPDTRRYIRAIYTKYTGYIPDQTHYYTLRYTDTIYIKISYLRLIYMEYSQFDKSCKMEILHLVNSTRFQQLLQQFDLVVQNVSWKNTVKIKGSSWGNNISDTTLYISDVHGSQMVPVIRKPNFTYNTADMPIEKFSCNVNGHQMSLADYLDNLDQYTKKTGRLKNIRIPRDKIILTTTQTCILPFGDEEIEFQPYIYNRNSKKNDPRLLVIMSSAQGTSCQITYKTTPLYLNIDGKCGVFTAASLCEDKKKIGVKQDGVIYIYQIPLKETEEARKDRLHKAKYYDYFNTIVLASCEGSDSDIDSDDIGGLFDSDSDSVIHASSKKKDTDYGIISVQKIDINFAGLGNNDFLLERDPHYPIRCTIQYYRLSNTSEISSETISEISDEMNKMLARH